MCNSVLGCLGKKIKQQTPQMILVLLQPYTGITHQAIFKVEKKLERY